MHGAAGPTPEADVDLRAWAQQAFAALTGLPGVRRAGLALVEGGGRRLRFSASDRTDPADVDWCHIDAYDDVPLNTAIRGGRPVVGDLDSLAERYAAFVGRQRESTTRAVAAVPMVAAGQTVGAYVLFYDRDQAYDDAQLAVLERLAAELGESLRHLQRAQRRPPGPWSDASVADGARVAGHRVRSDPAAVAEARRFLRGTLREWGVDEETTDAAVLCLSELVTNAVVHAQTGCEVRVLLEPGVVTTSVRDNGVRSRVTAERLDDPLRVHGRGLQLVGVLASRWGSDLDATGTTVWFTLDV